MECARRPRDGGRVPAGAEKLSTLPFAKQQIKEFGYINTTETKRDPVAAGAGAGRGVEAYRRGTRVWKYLKSREVS